MLHRCPTALLIAFAGIMATTMSVSAQTADIPFSGTVPGLATFTNVDPGTADTNTTTVSPDVRSTGSPDTLESVTPATVGVESTTSATITVSEPVLVSGSTPDPPGTIRVGFLRFGSTEVRSDVGGGSAPLTPGATDLEVDMLIERPDPFPPGTYTYVVTLTITP